jgi:hypothetical protein
MTNEEIRIKIAEVMGLKFVRAGHIKMPNAQEMWPDHWQDTRGKRKRIDGSIVGIPVALPNYPESLDACAEFEKTLTDDEWNTYCAVIVSMSLWDRATDTVRRILQVTALQRCLAYLKTKGLIP